MLIIIKQKIQVVPVTDKYVCKTSCAVITIQQEKLVNFEQKYCDRPTRVYFFLKSYAGCFQIFIIITASQTQHLGDILALRTTKNDLPQTFLFKTHQFFIDYH